MMDRDGLTKLMEECGELTQIAAKKSAFMETDEHPDGKGSMAARLEDEMGDVLAAIHFVAAELGLDWERIAHRKSDKIRTLTRWHEAPEKHS